MPRPLRTVRPPSAPAATAKKSSAAAKPSTTKSRTTRSGAKDIPNPEPKAPALLPSPSSDEPPKKPSPARKAAAKGTKAPLAKRSTRSKAPATTTKEAIPAPKLRATRRKPVAKEPEPVPEQEQEPEVEAEPEPLLPSLALSPPPPSSSEVLASSNAENRTPSPQFRSSPPPMLSTPPPQTVTKRRIVLEFSSDAGYSTPPMLSTPPPQTVTKRRIVLEFSSDAGYSPPPARPASAERPRLRELQPISLEPLGPTESDIDEENTDPRASPTPKRGKRSGFAPFVQEGRGGMPSAFYIPSADEEPFIIYSDPKSSTPPTLPRDTAFDDTMRPPESSPITTPVKMRKRRSSGTVVDSDDDVAEQGGLGDEVEKAADRNGKRRKAAVVEEQLMTTADLRNMLPRRKYTKAEKGEYDVPSTSEDAVESENGSSDELSRPTTSRTTRSGRAGAKKTAVKAKSAKTTKTAKKTTTKSRNTHATTALKHPSSTRVSKTYTRKSFSSEKENDSPTKFRNQNRRDSAVDAAGPSSSGDETVVADTGKNVLKEVVEKFKEVDRWEMEFEDLSPRSLEIESEGAR